MSINNSPEAQLVITVPTPYSPDLAYKARARMTIGVLTLLVAQAQQEIVIAAPYLQQDHGLGRPPLSDALEDALARGVKIHIASTGSALESVDIGERNEQYRSQIYLYQPQRNIDNDRVIGSHAKFCLADGKQAYIGSANLTRPGLGEHLELGVLVEGTLAQQVKALWDNLVEIGFFVLMK